MNQGSAVMGLIIIAGLVMAYGWPAAAIMGIPLALDLLIGRVLLPLLGSSFLVGRGGRQSQPLTELEKALRRGSRGFAQCVFAVLAAVALHVWFYGWRDFAGMLARPEEFW